MLGAPAYQKHTLCMQMLLAHKDKLNEDHDETMRPCTKGYLIRCSYNITVETVFTSWCCGQQCHSIILPVNIVASPTPNWDGVQQPKDWNPHTISVE